MKFILALIYFALLKFVLKNHYLNMLQDVLLQNSLNLSVRLKISFLSYMHGAHKFQVNSFDNLILLDNLSGIHKSPFALNEIPARLHVGAFIDNCSKWALKHLRQWSSYV